MLLHYNNQDISIPLLVFREPTGKLIKQRVKNESTSFNGLITTTAAPRYGLSKINSIPRPATFCGGEGSCFLGVMDYGDKISLLYCSYYPEKLFLPKRNVYIWKMCFASVCFLLIYEPGYFHVAKLKSHLLFIFASLRFIRPGN